MLGIKYWESFPKHVPLSTLPATVGESNWTFRLPWPSDRLDEVAEARERQSKLRAWAEEYQRVGE